LDELTTNGNGQGQEDATTRVLDFVNRLRTGYQRTGLAVAIGLFAIGAALAVTSIDIDWTDINWALLALVASLGVPPMILLNGAEVRAAADQGDAEAISWHQAIGVAVAGTAANLLPIPGAALVRIEALTASGATGRSAARATIAIGTIWIALSSILAGILLLGVTAVAGAIALSVGVAAGVTARILTRRGTSARWTLRVVTIEAGALAITALRLWAIAAALGVELQLRAAAIMAVSYAVSSAVGFFPGGLGLREAVSSGLGTLAGAPRSVGFVLSAVDRVVGLFVHVIIGIALAFRSKRPKG
jgi:hypothetical protein